MTSKWLANAKDLQQVRFSECHWEHVQLAQDLPDCRLEVRRGPGREEPDCYLSLAGDSMRKTRTDVFQHCLWCPTRVSRYPVNDSALTQGAATTVDSERRARAVEERSRREPVQFSTPLPG